MAEITNGIRSILSFPWIYSYSQRLVGAGRLRSKLVKEHFRPNSGIRVLDIGCGPADILELLPDVEYIGLDLSADYVENARKKYGSRGVFHCRCLDEATRLEFEPVDLIFAVGLVHHLDDEPARNLFRNSAALLKPQGRMVTVDPCKANGQPFLARWLIQNDRGQNVRRSLEYESLASEYFEEVSWIERWDLLYVPYTHTVLECRGPTS